MMWVAFIGLLFILIMSVGSRQEDKQKYEDKEKSYFLELANKISDLEYTISDLENTVADLTKEIHDLSQQPKYTKNKKTKNE